MRMEFDVDKSEKDEDALIGCSWLLGGLLIGVARPVGSIGAGVMFGAAWGFLCYASFLVLCAFLLFCWARRMGAHGRRRSARRAGRARRAEGRLRWGRLTRGTLRRSSKT